MLEMIDGEPPYFSEPPLQAMRKLRDMDPPITRSNEEVRGLGLAEINPVQKRKETGKRTPSRNLPVTPRKYCSIALGFHLDTEKLEPTCTA